MFGAEAREPMPHVCGCLPLPSLRALLASLLPAMVLE